MLTVRAFDIERVQQETYRAATGMLPRALFETIVDFELII